MDITIPITCAALRAHWDMVGGNLWPTHWPGTVRVVRFRRNALTNLVGPRGLERPTRPLYPDVSGAYASHRLRIMARYFLERRTIGIGWRHVGLLRLL